MSRKLKPLVSVLISAYNEEDWIEPAVKSILRQTYREFELIIINDGSTDKTLDILKQLKKQDKRIRIINQKNTGLTMALNKGLKYCTGKYIARMDADNISLPTRFAKQIAFLEKNKDYALVGTWREDIFPGNRRRILRSPTKNKDIQRMLVKSCVISHSSVMARTDILKRYRYDENFQTSEDYELWTRIGEQHKLANLKEVLTQAHYRLKSLTKTRGVLKTAWYHIKIKYKAYKNLECPWWYCIYVLKPIIKLPIPERIIQKYVDLKMNSLKRS